GGFMQPQGHVQVLGHCIDEGHSPQEALDAPRFQWIKEGTVLVEPDMDPVTAAALRERGHDIVTCDDPGTFGRGQIIWRSEDGTLCGATEKRTDGCVAAF
ncbi:MAG: gamma-glutamyltransferase, partial [Spirochaetales bacterium]